MFPTLPYTISPGDVLGVSVAGTLLDLPIDGYFLVEAAGTIPLGPAYGRAEVKGLTLEAAEKAIHKKLERVLQKPRVQVALPINWVDSPGVPAIHWQDVAMPKAPYTIKVGDLLLIYVAGTILDRPIHGVYLVEPAGSVPLGPVYGRAKVQGLTLEGAEKAIEEKLKEVAGNPQVSVTLGGWVGRDLTFSRGSHYAGPDPRFIPPRKRSGDDKRGF